MTVNQLSQTTQSEFEQLYTMKSRVSDRTQLNLRRALVGDTSDTDVCHQPSTQNG